MQPGEVEYEFGVAIPGPILPAAEWARTGVKRLPEPGRLDWGSFFGRAAPVVLDLGCGNGRFVVHDVRAFLATYVAAASVAEIHLYHPQPYHDPRQAHRRVITPRFLADVHRALLPSGLFVIQTDNPDYWSYMVRVVPHFFVLQEQESPWPDAPEGRTRREIIARQRGLRIFRGLGTRRDDLDRQAALALAGSLPEPRFRSRGPWCELDRWEESHD